MSQFVFIVALMFLLSGCPANDDYENLGNGYSYFQVHPNASDISFKGIGIIIGPTIISYATNEKYIAALEQPLTMYTEENVGKSRMEKRCEYWIVNKETHQLTGPLTKVEYVVKSVEVGIPIDRLNKAVSSKTSTYCLNK